VFLGHMVDACVSAFRRNAMPPLSQRLYLLHVDAEVVGKKGMCQLFGQVGRYVAIQSNGRAKQIIN
jgi:hypothetical protein